MTGEGFGTGVIRVSTGAGVGYSFRIGQGAAGAESVHGALTGPTVEYLMRRGRRRAARCQSGTA